MYIKSFLKDKNTVLVKINKMLDCIGNRFDGNNGTKDYISNLGLTEERSNELFGFGIETLLSLSLTTKDLGSTIDIEIKVPDTDYDGISDLVFIGCPKEELIPLSEEMLKMIVNNK